MFSEQRIYPNGLKLIVNQTDSPLACVLVRVETGVANELKKEEGITSILENFLLCGTSMYPSKNSLKSVVYSFGGELNAISDFDSIKIYITCLPRHVKEAVEILSQVVFDSTMSETSLKEIKEQIDDYRKAQTEQPFLLAYDNFREIMFSGSGFDKNFLGRKRSVDALSANDIKSFWQKTLCAQNIIVSISGNVEVDEAYEHVMHNFYGKLLQADGKKVKDIGVYKNDSTLRFVLDTKKLNQNRIVVGYQTEGFTSKSYYALYLMRQMVDAKLKDKFDNSDDVYFANCFMNNFVHNGLFFVRFAVDNDSALNAVYKVAESLCRLATDGVSNTEFVSFKEIFKTRFLKLFENSISLSKMSAKYTRYFGYAFDLEHELKQIDNLTQGDCLKAFRKMIKTNPFMSVVGSSKLDEKLYYKFFDKMKTIG